MRCRIVACAIVASLTALLAAACGGDHAGSPASSVCGPGTQLGSVTLGTGEIVEFVEASDHRSLCLGSNMGGPARLELATNAPAVTTPQLRGAGTATSSGWYYFFVLPEGMPPDLHVRTASDSALTSVMSTNHRYLVVFDAGAEQRATPDRWVDHTWDLVSGDGETRTTVRVTGPPTGPAPTGLADVLACLRTQGLPLPERTTPATVGNPWGVIDHALDPAATAAAWQACHSVYDRAVAQMGSGAGSADTAAFVDCMATRGWLQVFLMTPADPKAHEDAALSCRTRRPAAAVAECLRAHGLTVPDVAGSGTSTVQPYPPSQAVPAWEACRDRYVEAAAIPAQAVPQGMRRLDCMAEQGWITVVLTELPTSAAFDAARQACPPGFGP